MTCSAIGGGPVDQEQQFILRLPENTCAQLCADLDSGVNLKDKMSLEMRSDHRTAIVRYNGQVYRGKMVDLPCVIESLKTVDGAKNFYKTADISQMLLCGQGDDVEKLLQAQAVRRSRNKSKIIKVDRHFQWTHGITPPLKNVRKRRFRKTMKKKFMDMPEIEKEVKRLLRVDAEAVDVSWEVVADPEENAKGSIVGVEVEKSSLVVGEGSSSKGGNSFVTSARSIGGGDASREKSSNLLSIAAQEIFGELSDSEEETTGVSAAEHQLFNIERFRSTSIGAGGDLSSDFDLDLSNNAAGGQEDDDSNMGPCPAVAPALHFTAPLPEGLLGDEVGTATGGADDDSDMEILSESGSVISPARLSKISQQVSHLTKEIQSLKNKIAIRQSQLAEHTDNETFRNKMETDIYTYRTQLSEKRRKYERLSGLLELAGRADLT